MNKQQTAMDNVFAELRNMSEFAGALKAGLAFKKMLMDDATLNPDFKIRMITAIDDAIASINPESIELSDITVGDVINKMENNEAI
jgi:hypothetical protein